MKLKKLLSLVVVMMLVVTTLPAVVHAAEMTYMDWNYTTKQLEEKTSEADPVKITSTTTELQAGWYYVTGTVSKSSTVYFSGDVHIIFKEGSIYIIIRPFSKTIKTSNNYFLCTNFL